MVMWTTSRRLSAYFNRLRSSRIIGTDSRSLCGPVDGRGAHLPPILSSIQCDGAFRRLRCFFGPRAIFYLPLVYLAFSESTSAAAPEVNNFVVKFLEYFAARGADLCFLSRARLRSADAGVWIRGGGGWGVAEKGMASSPAAPMSAVQFARSYAAVRDKLRKRSGRVRPVAATAARTDLARLADQFDPDEDAKLRAFCAKALAHCDRLL